MLFLLLAFSIPEKKLIGHWIVLKGDLYEMNSGDTLVLAKKKRTEKMYEWGSGVLMGMEFCKDSTFNEYHNVLCSTESSPVFNYAEKWQLENKDENGINSSRTSSSSVLVIKGAERTLRFEIVSLSSGNLTLIKK